MTLISENIYSRRKMKRKAKVVVRSFFHRKVKGIFNPIPYRVVCDSADWTPLFGNTVIEKQKYGAWDTDDCWQYSGVKGLELQFNNLWARGEFPNEAKQFFVSNNIATPSGIFNISDRFYGILGGNRNNGGTAEELFQLVQKYGIIPHDALAYSDAQANACLTYQSFLDDYFNPNAVTKDMLDLGKQSLKYFNLNYQRIGTAWEIPDYTLLYGAMLQAPLAYGVPVFYGSWNQVNVPAYTKAELDHEVTGYKISQNGGGYPIIDNYNPYLKVLADGYGIYSVTQGVITAIPVPVPSINTSLGDSIWSAVMSYFRKLGLISA